jgi:hypothetical protein
MDPIEDLMLRAYPNQERVGCPGAETIQALGAKALPHGHPAWEHIWKCSPCFAEFQKLRDARLSREKAGKLRLTILGGSLAAVLLVCIGFATNYFALKGHAISAVQPQKNPATAKDVYVAAVFNFEATSNERSVSDDSRASDSPSISKVQKLPRRAVELTVYLARGSEDGEYQLELLDSRDRVKISTKGQAAIDKGLTRFTTVVNLLNVVPGEYTVRSRRLPDGTWRSSKTMVE